MSKRATEAGAEESLSPYVHFWQRQSGGGVFFDALSYEVVGTEAQTVEEALATDPVREHLEEEGMVLSAEDEPIERQVESQWETYTEPNINSLYLMLNRTCNLDCEYCFLPPEEHPLDPDTAKRAVRMLGEIDTPAKNIIFYGGEPLAEFGLIREIVEMTDGEWYYSLPTNGTLITPERAAFFDEHEFSITVSIDGPPEIHDQMRRFDCGGGTYEQAANGIRNLQEQGLSYQLTCTVNEHNVERLPEVVRHLETEFDPAGISLNYPRLSGKGADAEAMSITADQLSEAWLELIEAYAADEIDTLPTEIYSRFIRPLTEGDSPMLHCAGCRLHTVLNPDGQLGPCMAADTLDGTDDDLFWCDIDDIDSFDDLETSDLMDTWQGTLPVEREACHECPAFLICGGGCPYNAYEGLGDLQQKSPRYCQFMRKTLKGVIERWM